jgi:predicted nucleic acid binding AN1-type Zn finger protein
LAARQALAEKAAWEFMSTQKPHFTYTSLCIPLIIGPPAQVIDSMDALPASCAELWSLFSGKRQDLSKTPWPYWIDVRDV